MPCRCDEDYGETANQKLRRDLDALTAMLCRTNAIIDKFMAGQECGAFDPRDENTLSWWLSHQEADERREQYERERREQAERRKALRKSALAKLTAEEAKELDL
jgi:hypothetical protein